MLVVGLGWLDLRRVVACGDVAEEAQGIRLVTTFLIRTAERQRALGEGVCFLQSTGQHLCLS